MKYILILASILGAFAVALGAYGSHGLTRIAPEHLVTLFNLGVQYQFYHCFALLGCGLLWPFAHHKLLVASSLSFVLGMAGFSGTLYVYAITSVKPFGLITPIGGSLLILGWILMCVAIIVGNREERSL
ncbi:DUF423 domain-containing protein [Paraferrimonas haliotis]|uniref:Membrane protein n=1 Tax=Paraferrimonas haliotis TaxID=2013866 RepID=A0AA37TNZ1_9GAMM|nr:DUF423 domain-containing protein [Paraferrimonas haliotis]GLS82965.1 membrane protein [Paraferrimonas haliotis]